MSSSGYGTISEEEPEEASSSNKEFLQRAKEQLQTIVGTAKPWKDMMNPSRLARPFSFFNFLQRMKRNARVFRTNYVMVILLMVLLTLLWHPLCVIIYCALMAAWMVLYLVRDNPPRICGFAIDERLVAVLLLMVTVGLVCLSNVTDNILVGVGVGVLIVLVHAVLRETEEDEEDGAGIRLRHAASSSFTA
ncbi:PRA1 family protein F3-like [Neltuma alba]|uniref:PRA1 family protein F3-like n=1 Tax=Neltuma alba TaxID=207710 RepID=UPI0010A45C30|nr:PRA1 family protein F3-like [Prosopis alba]